MDEVATSQLRQVPGVGGSSNREFPELPCILVGRDEVDGISAPLHGLDDVALHSSHAPLRVDAGAKHENSRHRHLLDRPSQAA